MNRVTTTFLVLLGLATLASGQLWMRGRALGAGQGAILNVAPAILSAALLMLALLGLGRILYPTTSTPQTVGDDEDLHEEFTVPTDAPPDVYQVRATSAEGEVLTAELTVEAGAATAERAAPSEPSGEPMQLDRRRSGGELVVIVVGLLASAGLGLALVHMRR